MSLYVLYFLLLLPHTIVMHKRHFDGSFPEHIVFPLFPASYPHNIETCAPNPKNERVKQILSWYSIGNPSSWNMAVDFHDGGSEMSLSLIWLWCFCNYHLLLCNHHVCWTSLCLFWRLLITQSIGAIQQNSRDTPTFQWDICHEFLKILILCRYWMVWHHVHCKWQIIHERWNITIIFHLALILSVYIICSHYCYNC